MEIRQVLFESNIEKIEKGFSLVYEQLNAFDESEVSDLRKLVLKAQAQIKLLQNPEFVSVHYGTGKWFRLYRQLKLELRIATRRLARTVGMRNRMLKKSAANFQVATAAA